MTERDIREQTERLWEAFSSMTDESCPPTVEEFLRFREAAVKELQLFRGLLGEGAGGKKKQCRSAPERVRNDSTIVVSAGGEIPFEEERFTQDIGKAPSTKSAREERVPDTDTEGPPAPAQRSEYEILRGIRDAWN